MKARIRYGFLVVGFVGLTLLGAACSSVEAEPGHEWSGTWLYQDESAQLQAVLVQQGDQLTGSVERIFRVEGEDIVTTYSLEATIEGTQAKGHLVAGADRLPMQLVRQASSLRLEVMIWSWIPVLSRAA